MSFFTEPTFGLLIFAELVSTVSAILVTRKLIRFKKRNDHKFQGSEQAIRNDDFGFLFTFIWGFAVLAPMVGMAATTTWVADQTALVDKQTHRVTAVIEEGRWSWKWGVMKDVYRVPYGRNESRVVRMNTSPPITDNPKVRRLYYDVQILVLSSPQDVEPLLTEMRREPNWIDPNDWLKSRLYELNEQHSRELAQFYNPLDREQQILFQHMVARFLAPDLERAHVRLVSAQFGLE